MGKGWVRTPEQKAYLEGEFQSYMKARKDGEVKNWRAILHEKWEEQWPERQVLMNEWKLSDDTPFNAAQMETLGEALAARKKVEYVFTSQLFFYLMAFFFLATLQLHSLAHRCKTRSQQKPTKHTHSLHPKVCEEELQAQAEAYDP